MENTRGILDTAFAFKELKILYRSRAFWAKKIACAQVTKQGRTKEGKHGCSEWNSLQRYGKSQIIQGLEVHVKDVGLHYKDNGKPLKASK